MATTKATLLGHRSATSFSDLTLSGDLTVNGTTTTLDTAVQNVDKLEIGASSTDYGAKINQASTGNILQLQDGGTDVMVVEDGGKVGIGTDDPKSRLNISDSAGATTFIVTDPTRNASGEHWYLRNTGGNFYIGQATDSGGAWDSLQARVTVEDGGHVGINETSPGHVFEAKSTDNASFLLNRDAGSNEGSLSDMNNFYSLSIKNRNSGSYLRFGGGLAETTIQATDGAGTPAAKGIALQPYGGFVTIGTTGEIVPMALAHQVNDIQVNTATTIGQLNQHTGVIYINSGHGSFIPFYARGGGGVAWKVTWLQVDTGSWITGNSFSFTESGSTPNTYTLDMSTGGGVLTTARTNGTRNYSVTVFKRNFAST